jgi:hypothetical protein
VPKVFGTHVEVTRSQARASTLEVSSAVNSFRISASMAEKAAASPKVSSHAQISAESPHSSSIQTQAIQSGKLPVRRVVATADGPRRPHAIFVLLFLYMARRKAFNPNAMRLPQVPIFHRRTPIQIPTMTKQDLSRTIYRRR